MNRVILLAVVLLSVASCVKVDETPLVIEAGEVQITLRQLNHPSCVIDENLPVASYFDIEIPILNLEDILIEKLKLQTEEFDPIEVTAFEYFDKAITLEWCYLFLNNEKYRTKITIEATNKTGEKISNKDLSFVVEKPLGAN